MTGEPYQLWIMGPTGWQAIGTFSRFDLGDMLTRGMQFFIQGTAFQVEFTGIQRYFVWRT